MDLAGSLVALGFLSLVYFLPTLYAAINGRPNTAAIGALNLLLGWTFIGWVVAFVWALTGKPKESTAQVMPPYITVQEGKLVDRRVSELRPDGSYIMRDPVTMKRYDVATGREIAA